MKMDPMDDTTDIRELAAYFLERAGVTPTPDVVDQLVEAFLPCLRIIAARGYNPEGATWKRTGWRGQLYEILKRVERLRYHSWENDHRGHYAEDTPADLINYLGFYIRSHDGTAWGELGEPGGLIDTAEVERRLRNIEALQKAIEQSRQDVTLQEASEADLPWDEQIHPYQLPHPIDVPDYMPKRQPTIPPGSMASLEDGTPAIPPGYCGACARSGVGACDDFPNCPNGKGQRTGDPGAAAGKTHAEAREAWLTESGHAVNADPEPHETGEAQYIPRHQLTPGGPIHGGFTVQVPIDEGNPYPERNSPLPGPSGTTDGDPFPEESERWQGPMTEDTMPDGSRITPPTMPPRDEDIPAPPYGTFRKRGRMVKDGPPTIPPGSMPTLEDGTPDFSHEPGRKRGRPVKDDPQA